ncbi:MAG: DUF2130 domain-containing protein [Desulfobacterota bacterium]|nr:DUF2130 domain-containing protein [Thermodesulfobacteriota bacterium]
MKSVTPPTITCPYCHREILLSEAITHSIREEVEKEFGKRLAEKELELIRKEELLGQKERSLSEELAEKLRVERERIEAESRKKLEEAFGLQILDLEAALKQREEQLEKMRQAELQLRRERRELEERQRSLELEMVRRLDEERERIRQEAERRVVEEHRLKDLEKEKQINDLKRHIEELQRKAEQTPIQLRGEVLELEIEEVLKSHFPMDRIEPVSKGKRGADLLQRVQNSRGELCGTIIWEAKRARNWNDDWLDKLKEDQREAKAEIAVLVTTALPKEVDHFGLLQGVWVTEYPLAPCLAMALRVNLLDLAKEKKASEGKHEKMEALYAYLTGSEFKQRVEAVVRAFLAMKEDLESEKAALQRIWAKREKQIERVLTHVSRLVGDMQGIIGASLPEIKSLELKNLADTEGEGDLPKII